MTYNFLFHSAYCYILKNDILREDIINIIIKLQYNLTTQKYVNTTNLIFSAFLSLNPIKHIVTRVQNNKSNI